MALKCDFCHKGRDTGHNVSHAKNRTPRFFRPNVQQLKVHRNGLVVRVKFCTRCIKRLKNFGRIGIYTPMYSATTASAEKPAQGSTRPSIPQETQSLDQLLAKQGITLESPVKEKAKRAKKTKEKENMDISDIVGKE